ncbi:ANTAR domain-containing protein [Blastococcus montanus]|uniref:ANTAR domain-containing protein n=1 Tax=Blastococcus montanus TaxID=3144973 RepID=UPI00320B4606
MTHPTPPLARRSAQQPTAGRPRRSVSRVPGAPRDQGGARSPGRYRFDGRSGAWWWSPELTELLGATAGVTPCTETFVAPQHPDDRERTVAALTAACAEARTFSLQVRLVDGPGPERAAMLVGEPSRADEGAVEGLLVEIPAVSGGSGADRLSALEAEAAQLRTAMASRAVIEQAKGILMLLTSCGEQVAFGLLTHISSHTHRKVRDVALAITESAVGRGALPDDVRRILRDACPPARPAH